MEAGGDLVGVLVGVEGGDGGGSGSAAKKIAELDIPATPFSSFKLIRIM